MGRGFIKLGSRKFVFFLVVGVWGKFFCGFSFVFCKVGRLYIGKDRF